MASRETTKVWDTYVAEADAPDFILKVDADTTIRVTNPTGQRVIRLAQAQRAGDLEAVLVALCGDVYPDVSRLLAKAGHKALPKLVEDLMAHFDMYETFELEGPGGGTVKASRPTELQGLLNMGYRVKGGAGAPRT